MKILIRATNWVGDAIMALPALRAVHKRFPGAEIAIVARPSVADIYRDQQICDQLIPYDPQGIHAGFSGREMPLTPLGSAGARIFPNASVMPATAAAFFSPRLFLFPNQARFPRTKSFIIWNCSIARAGLIP